MRRNSLPLLFAILTPSTARPRSIHARDFAQTWTYTGCYADSIDSRTLERDYWLSGDSMSIEACQSYCDAAGHSVAGLEYSSQCYCGDSLPASAGPTDASTCSMSCSGNSTQTCGGPNRLSVYSAVDTTTNSGGNGFSHMGCYEDAVGMRTLAYWVIVNGGWKAMTVGVCVAACSANGYTLAGLEYGQECWCDNTIGNGGTSSNNCDIPCKGNTYEFCGGNNALNIYSLSSSTSSPAMTPVASSSTSMTIPAASSTSPASVPTQSELMTNGNFTDTTGWTLSSNPQTQGSTTLSGIYLSNQGSNAYQISSGTYYAYSYASRSLCISQSFTYPSTGSWNFSSQIGRSIPDSKGGTSNDQLSYAVFVDSNQIRSGSVCNPSLRACTASGPFGSYNLVTAYIQAANRDLSGGHTIAICATFGTSGSADVLDSFVVDRVSLFGPKGSG